MSGARRESLDDQARQLPKEELSGVWGLCQGGATSVQDRRGARVPAVAMQRVALFLQGIALPHALPACLQQHRDARLGGGGGSVEALSSK